MADRETPWFAGRAGRVLAYRVNRRPLPEDNLFAEPGLPEDVFEHFARVLAPGYPVVTGTRYQRRWLVGNLEVDSVDRTIVGRIGWEPLRKAFVQRWSTDAKGWLETPADPSDGEVMPFAFDGETRLLGVLRAPDSDPSTIATVFDTVLNDNERQLLERTTDWSVEPLLDRETFLTWLDKTEVVRSVTFTAQLPNPEPDEAFNDLFQRMQQRRATHLSETMRSNSEAGLRAVTEDRHFAQAMTMAERGFAELRGEGVREGHRTSFNQREAVASEEVEDLPATYAGAAAMLRDLVKGDLRRFLGKD